MESILRLEGISQDELRNFRGKIAAVLLVTSDVEQDAVLKVLRPLDDRKVCLTGNLGLESFVLGNVGAHSCGVVRCTQGSMGPGGSGETIGHAIDIFEPQAVIAVGMAFGRDSEGQKIADILLSRQLVLYESERRGPTRYPRGSISDGSSRLLSLFQVAYRSWHTPTEEARPNLEDGLMLTGEKLVDNPHFKRELFSRYPEAIGGEMEGSGLYAAAHRRRTDWIVVKAICDWGENKHEDKLIRQRAAAKAAVGLVLHALSIDHALDPPSPSAPQFTIRKSPDISRKHWIETAGILIAGVAAGIEISRHRGTVTPPIYNAYREQEELPGERLSLLRCLFWVEIRGILRPGDKHVYQDPGTRKTFPHEAKAMAAFCRMTGSVLEPSANLALEEQSLDTDVCTGSPIANPLAGRYLPCAFAGLEDKSSLNTVVPADIIPYHFLRGSSQTIHVRSGMHDGEIKPKLNHGLHIRSSEQRRHEWRPRQYAKSVKLGSKYILGLNRDFLLVSRFPKGRGEGDIIIISGGHGSGTQSLELLMDNVAFPIEELRGLIKLLDGKRYFQFVLEASEMVHDPPMTVARRIEVSRECPPIAFDPGVFLQPLTTEG